MEIREISFDDILPVWKNNLWVGRKSSINPVSTIQFLGSYDLALKRSKPIFFGAFVDNEIAGVISGFKTSREMYRCRGIYVFNKFRRKGYSQRLFSSCEAQALKEGTMFIWSLPKNKQYWHTRSLVSLRFLHGFMNMNSVPTVLF